MKVLNLQCSRQHTFEGWFASEDDFQSQLGRRLVECPLCSDANVQKLPSAPRLIFGGTSSRSAEPNGAVEASLANAAEHASRPAAVQDLTLVSGNKAVPSLAEQTALFKAIRHVLANTEDVGNRFADEARAMHYGDAQSRNIRGQASMREVLELKDEGIGVMPLPMPVALKETLQ